ncbi:unnamed protein product [Staurois parvus]|uniref:Uncharacterized protein n=1 Tax=Staurois parvus TaxID=386267 RepID=A0ABN9GTZ7_9NEOB|nr:unnamed protein product [Staurois parvus]
MDALTPGCHQILSSHGPPSFTILQNMAALSSLCENSTCS